MSETKNPDQEDDAEGTVGSNDDQFRHSADQEDEGTNPGPIGDDSPDESVETLESSENVEALGEYEYEEPDPEDAETSASSQEDLAEPDQFDPKSDEIVEDAVVVDEPVDTSRDDVVPQRPPIQEPRSASPLPLLIGGLVAGALGFGGAYLGLQNQPTPDDSELRTSIDQQAAVIKTLESEVSALSARIAELQTPQEPQDISGELDALRQEILSALPESPDFSGDIEALKTEIGELGSRMAAFASEATSGVSDLTAEELDAFREEVRTAISGAQDSISDAMSGAQSNIASVVEAARSELEAIRAEADAAEAEATEAATDAALEAGIAQIAASLDAGTAFSAPLVSVSEAGANPPAALTEYAETGIPTMPALTEAFPAAARSALEASIRGETAGSPTERVMAFLRVQTGARSLEPREGDDPDAVLSRSEAALKSGDLATSVAELSALPAPGQEAMSSWVSEAEKRLGALEALSELRASTGTN